MWPQSKATLTGEAPMFRLLPALAAGIIYYDKYLQASLPGIIIYTACAFLLFLIVSFLLATYLWLKNVQWLLVQVILFATGMMLCSSADVRQQKNWPGSNLNRYGAVLAVINNVAKQKTATQKLRVQLLAGIKDSSAIPISGNALVHVYHKGLPTSFGLYDTIMLPPKWQPVKNRNNPFEFDYATYCRRQNIYYTQLVEPGEIMLVHKAASHKLPLTIQAHQWCMAQLRHYVKDSTTLGILEAMIIGYESDINPGMQQAYADTGIIHIISISGSHVATLFLAISFLFGWIRHRKYRWIPYTAGILFTWFYVVMAGASPSAVRSAIMFSIPGLGIIINRQAPPLNQLFTAVFFILLVQPYWLFSVGFQLSFTAILSMIIFYRRINHLYQPRHYISGIFWNIISASIAAEILIAPLAAYYFHSFPPLFIVANILTFFAINLVLISGIAVIIFCFVPGLAQLLAMLATTILHLFNTCIYFLQSYQVPSLQAIHFSTLFLLLIYAIISCISLYLIKGNKKALFAGLSVLLVLLSLSVIQQWKLLRQERLIVYNDNKQCAVELIKGASFSRPVSPGNHKNYVSHTAHMGYGCMLEKVLKNPVIHIGDKKIFLLEKGFTAASSVAFPIDILVISADLKTVSFHSVQNIFHPSEIVTGNNQHKSQVDQWTKLCREASIKYHHTARDGAYVIGQ